MKIRVADWNVRGFAHPAAQLQLLDAEKPDIILLQDVSHHGRQAICGDSRWHCAEEGSSERCLILATDSWRFAAAASLPCPAAERIRAVTAAHGGIALTVLCCYAPTNSGKNRRERRATFFDALAAWMVTAPCPLCWAWMPTDRAGTTRSRTGAPGGPLPRSWSWDRPR